MSLQVINALAEAEGVDPEALSPPLYDVIDPESLDSIFAPANGRYRDGTVAFTYERYLVVVDSVHGVLIE